MRSKSSPRARPTALPTDGTSHTGGQSPGSMRGWRRRRALDLEAPQHALGDATPYCDSGELLADLAILDRSLVANGSGILAKGRLKNWRRAIDAFGFHLAALDFAPELRRARAHGRRNARSRATRPRLCRSC